MCRPRAYSIPRRYSALAVCQGPVVPLSSLGGCRTQLYNGADAVRKGVFGGVCRVVVGRDGGFVVGEDRTQGVGSFEAVPMSSGVRRERFLVAEFSGFGAAFVYVRVVRVPSPAHGHVKQVAVGRLAEDRETCVGGDPLGGVHGDGVPEADVLADVFVAEENPGIVVEPFGRNTIRHGVDGCDSPPVSVAHRRQRFGVGSGVVEGDGGVVAAADYHIPHRHLVAASHRHG